jgi:acyl-coenzyme A synthetase/AMP-(fatty) acid ligase
MAIIGDAMARPLVEALAEPGASYDLAAVALVGSGGAILSREIKDKLREHLPGAFVMDSYGASETGHTGTVFDAGAPAAGPRFTLNERSAVFDEEGRRVEPGSERIGRIAQSGAIPLGYWKDEARTRTTFLELEGRRWVVPGDFARVEADGSVTLLGRGSVCINSGGEKVFPEEVEAALKSHPDVFDAVVVGVPDARFGERVAAVVKPRPGRSPGLDSLADHCRSRIAGYKVPRAVVLVEEIPRTPVGKPDYRRAARIARERQLV